jgi:acyl CoA:acetate/3-ketoacid CoA transferase beta subunit
MMEHVAKGKGAGAETEKKVLRRCTLPLTALGAVHLILTDLAVMEVTPRGLLLRERAPGVSVADVQAQTEPTLLVQGDVPEIHLAPA